MKLFMVLLGCKPEGRNTEQHDVFFGIGDSLKGLTPAFEAFWPGVRLHIDAWICVEHVDGFAVEVVEGTDDRQEHDLYFINLGGYLPGKFEEYHEKSLVVARSLNEAKARAKRGEFYRTGQALAAAARSHVDDTGSALDMVFDDDDAFPVRERLEHGYGVRLRASDHPASELHVGYIKLSKL